MNNPRTLWFSLLASAACLPMAGAQSTLTKIDLLPKSIPYGSRIEAARPKSKVVGQSEMIEFQGEYYFWANSHPGRHFYKTDGTSAGTQLVPGLLGYSGGGPGQAVVAGTDLFALGSTSSIVVVPGSGAAAYAITSLATGETLSDIDNLTATGNRVFFSAWTSTYGEEVYVTDGTVAGTTIAVDVVPGFSSSHLLQGFFERPQGGGILFAAGSAAGFLMWSTDGTPAGTHVLAGSRPASVTSPSGELVYPQRLPIAFGAYVPYSAWETSTGMELWMTDGTVAGTALLADLDPGPASSWPHFTPKGVIGSVMYFTATTAATGREIFQTDGTTAGTFLVGDFVPGPVGSEPVLLGVVGGSMLVSAELDPASVGRELYRLSGSSLVLVKDIAFGGEDSSPEPGPVLGGRMYFRVVRPGYSQELWATDGTTAGTVQIAMMDGTWFSAPSAITPISATQLVFCGSSPSTGEELFLTDGTSAGTGLLKEIETLEATFSSDPHDLVSMEGGHLFAKGELESGDTGIFHIESSGQFELVATNDDTGEVRAAWLADHAQTIFAGKSSAAALVNDSLFQTDGTALGTASFMKFANPGSTGVSVLGSNGTHWFLSAGTPSSDNELWISDGTAAGTTLLADIYPGPMESRPRKGTMYKGDLYFVADDGVHPGGLWRSDGTAAGTSLFKDIRQGLNPGVDNLTVGGDYLYFAANDGVHGSEVWKTDGTSAGTAMIADVAPGIGASFARHLTPMGDLLFYFTQTVIIGPSQLWVTDGTATGTHSIPGATKNHNVGSKPAVAGNRLFFYVDDPSSAGGLRATDGVTMQYIADVDPGGDDFIYNMTAVGDRVYFSAGIYPSDNELFVSDGTAIGTYQVTHLSTSYSSAAPSNLIASGGDLYFAATGSDNDRELYRYTEPGAHVLDLGYSGSGARLTATAPVLGKTTAISIANAPAGDIGVLVLSLPVGPNASFVLPGNASWIDPLWFQIVGASTAPSWSVPSAIPATPAFVGVQLNVQAWFLTPGLFPATTSNGLRLVLGN